MRWGSRTVCRWACLCGVAVAAVALPASSSAGPGAPVRIGGAPLLARDAKPVGTLAAGVPLHVTVTLKPRDPSGLEAYAQAVSTPGSSEYRQYLTGAQFAERFGATEAQVQAVEASLRAHGLTPGTPSADRLSVPVTATAARIGHAFSVSFRRMALPNGRRATVASAAPAVDSSIAGDVQSVVGLSSVGGLHPELKRRALPAPAHTRLRAGARHVATGGPQPCTAASSAAGAQGAYTADQIASAYGLSALYQAGDQGLGQTVAIYELEPNDPGDIAAYQSCYHTSAAVSYIPVDGGSGTGAGSGEAALDIENAIGLAPRASYLVYQGPNSDSSAPGSGPYDTFSAIVNQGRARVVSVSWGECEADNTDGLQAEHTLFEEAATRGQAIVSASGDEGSEDCFAPPGGFPPSVPNVSLAVDDPGSQQFVTSVGGTTLSTPGPRPGESVWNNGAASVLAGSGGAGGGGISQVWGIPGYQSGAPPGLHVAQSSAREVPDVSADADPNTGYIVYWNGSGADPLSTSGWQSFGGTSAAAPVWAALLALINASSACRSSPVGFANPALYRAAGASYGSKFNDITSGNNDLFGTGGGKYAAAGGFDMASGLGTPNAGGLASSLCAVALRVANPGAERSTVGKTVTLQMRTVGTAGGRIGWRASGLPPGLSISASTGRITGKPRRAGVYLVAVSGTEQGSPVGQAVFRWTVAGLPAVSRASVTGVGSGRPTLSLAIASGGHAAALKSVTIALPAGLRFTSRRGAVAVSGPRARRVRFRSRIVRGRLQITLLSPQTKIGLKIRISTTSALAGRVRSHRVRAVQVTVATTDAARQGATVRSRVRTA